MFKHKSKNIMASIGVWCYIILITILGFIYSFQDDTTQSLIKEHSLALTIFIVITFIIVIIKSQFIYIKTNFRKIDYNKSYTYHDLLHYKGVIPIIAVLGLSRTGKTTLIDSIFYNKPLNNRTQNINGRLKNIEGGKNVLIYDMSGESSLQINDVMELSDCIIFLLDHTESNSTPDIVNSRIEENIKLISMLRSSYDDKGHGKKIPTLFLINKSDLLGDGDLYEQFYKKEINAWRHVFGKNTNYLKYSNKYISESIDNKITCTSELSDVIKFIKENTYEK